MSEIKKRVNIYKIDFRCDICGTGFYRQTGVVNLTNPPKYPHRCTVCGAEMIVSGKTYPYMIEEEVDE